VIDITYDPPTRHGTKPLKWIVLDSLIIAGIAFLATLPQERIPTPTELYVALKAFAFSFLLQLAVERGIKPRRFRRRSYYGHG